ncbi:MAG: hypothetical protein JNM17_05590 [Archangium sp.]|nr:hypothetical protein [Archangium sp.]
MLSLVVALCVSQVPKGVTYVVAKPEVNAKAKAQLVKMFTGSPPQLQVAESKAGIVMLGPFLGQKLAALDMSGFLKTDVIVPFGDVTAQMSSYGSRSPEEFKAMMKLLRDLAPSGAVNIRPMTPEEMKLVWPFISWDLDEPLFVVESEGKKWLFDFDETGTQPFWIEDLSAPCFTAEALKGKCLCARVMKKKGNYELAFLEGNPCVDAGAQSSSPAPKNDNPLGLDRSVVDLLVTKFLIANSLMEQRITVDALAGYIKRLMAQVTQLASKFKTGAKPGALTLSVGIKPGGETRVWVTSSTSLPVSAILEKALGDTLRKVEGPDPRGVVVFQLHLQFFGGAKPPEDAFPNIPSEWQLIVDKEKTRIDAESLVLKAWK